MVRADLLEECCAALIAFVGQSGHLSSYCTGDLPESVALDAIREALPEWWKAFNSAKAAVPTVAPVMDDVNTSAPQRWTVRLIKTVNSYYAAVASIYPSRFPLSHIQLLALRGLIPGRFTAQARDSIIEAITDLKAATDAGITSGSTTTIATSDPPPRLTPRQRAITMMLSKLKSGRGLEGKEIAARLPKQHRKSETKLRRHDFPVLIAAGLIANTPGVGYHLVVPTH